MYQNHFYSSLKFNEEEVLYLKQTFNLSSNTETDLNIPNEYFDIIGLNNIDDDPYINFKYLIDKNKNEYLIISFIRYPFNYPERAKDQSDPFITYIHGIWENPLLTNEIIEKLKKS